MFRLVLLIGALGAPAPGDTGAAPARLIRSYTQHLAAAPRDVFPLLGPLGEKKWAAGWDPVFAYPPGGADEEGCVFTVPGHGETIWILTVFDEKSGRVDYVQVTPGVRVAQLHIALTPAGHGGTAAEITYTWTALSGKGSEFIEAHGGGLFDAAMAAWEGELNAYLGARPK